MKKHNYIVEKHAQVIAEKIRKEVEQIDEINVFKFLRAENINHNIMIESDSNNDELKRAVCKRVIEILFGR